MKDPRGLPIVYYPIIINGQKANAYIYEDKYIDKEKTYRIIIKSGSYFSKPIDSASEIKPLWNDFTEMIKEVFQEYNIKLDESE